MMNYQDMSQDLEISVIILGAAYSLCLISLITYLVP